MLLTQAYYMLDELLIGGEISETSKKNVLKAIAAQDMLQEVSVRACVRIYVVQPQSKQLNNVQVSHN